MPTWRRSASRRVRSTRSSVIASSGSSTTFRPGTRSSICASSSEAVDEHAWRAPLCRRRGRGGCPSRRGHGADGAAPSSKTRGARWRMSTDSRRSSAVGRQSEAWGIGGQTTDDRRPATDDGPLGRGDLTILALLALAKLLFHLATSHGYGIFRDELYYIACSDHLALGYVDHPSLSILLLWLSRHAFGDSLPALRFLPALAGAASVFIAGLIARELGGRRGAQVLAALAVFFAPVFMR